ENAGGMRSAKYGVTKHYVLGLEVVTPTGEIMRTGGRVSKNVVGFDLTGLICGSEGMLGIITEATLKLLPLPEATRTVRATFKTMTEACACVLRAATREDEEKLWDVRRALSPAIKKFGTMKFNEDVVVPRSRVPELIARVEEIGREFDTFVVNFGHAGDGNIHVNFMCDRADPEAVARAREAVGETFAASVELGGTISGEHGIGYV